MNCRQVRGEIAEWVRGRVSEQRANSLAEHCAACAKCRAAVEEERALLKLFQAAPQPPAVRDLWPDVMQRISERDCRRPRWFVRRWVFSGAVATAAACLVLAIVVRPGIERVASRSQSGVDEQRIVRMVADMQTLPEPDTSELWQSSTVASAAHFEAVEE